MEKLLAHSFLGCLLLGHLIQNWHGLLGEMCESFKEGKKKRTFRYLLWGKSCLSSRQIWIEQGQKENCAASWLGND
ncbi:hypothetical protein EV127DRAFT_420090 [Xylaria flabelliformis]|nr:hypothetical protein EV127DRAFT_420090 [Xylaria flabelliformis]